MNELSGGIKNALEKGGNLELIKQSFINAGYPVEEVEQAAAETGNFQAIQNTNYAPLPSDVIKEKKSSKTLVFLIVLVLILIAAGLIGIYWSKILQVFQ